MAPTFEADRLLINGRAVPGGGAPLQVEDPATEEVFTSVPTADAHQVEAAIAAARESFDTGVWADQSRDDRLATLARMARWLQEHRDLLVETAIREVGAPRS